MFRIHTYQSAPLPAKKIFEEYVLINLQVTPSLICSLGFMNMLRAIHEQTIHQ